MLSASEYKLVTVNKCFPFYHKAINISNSNVEATLKPNSESKPDKNLIKHYVISVYAGLQPTPRHKMHKQSGEQTEKLRTPLPLIPAVQHPKENIQTG